MEMDADQRRWLRERVLPLEPRLLSFALRLCAGQQVDAEDLVHETFARLMAYPRWDEIDCAATITMAGWAAIMMAGRIGCLG